MPAIDLARLKTQVARLSGQFSDPQAFLHSLNELLEFYTNHTKRFSQVAKRLSLPTFHTPMPVLRQVEHELTPLAGSMPEEAVVLTDALWKAGSLESRTLAARLLGMIPLAQAVPAFSRIPDWLAQSTDKLVRTALLTDSLSRLRCEDPEAFFNMLENWMKSPRSALQVWGLRALIPLLQDPDFENLPAVFRILRPTVEMAGPSTQIDLQACLVALEKISPTETLVFLREILKENHDQMLTRTLRRILPALPPSMQSGLRDLLHDRS